MIDFKNLNAVAVGEAMVEIAAFSNTCTRRDLIRRGFSAEELRPGVAQLRIELKYNEGEPVIKEITRVSKPGRRVYSKIQELPRVYAGLGVSILSTPRGVLSDAEARAANVGGEVLCRVF